MDWAVALYKRKNETLWAPYEALADSLGVVLRIFDGRRSTSVTCPYCPKLQFQLGFVDIVAPYDYVWLADDDIGFDRMNYARFWSAHQAAGSPLIAQGTVRQSTQGGVFYVNAHQWSACSNASTHVHGRQIEQQAPVVDTGFFAWLFPDLEVLAAREQLLGSDWGHDLIWCGAAQIYIDTVLPAPRPTCAVILESYDHWDYKTTKKNKKYRNGSIELYHTIFSGHFENPPGAIDIFAARQLRIHLNHTQLGGVVDCSVAEEERIRQRKAIAAD